jgi:hypothetical protein
MQFSAEAERDIVSRVNRPERKLGDQTSDDIDKEPPEERSLGCSET